jgi:hypothetical protein
MNVSYHAKIHKYERATDTPPSLHPDHLADLEKSGLSVTTISELDIHTIPPRWIAKHLGFDNPLIESVLCIPYPGLDGFCRDKVFPPLKDEDGHTKHYLQRKGSGVHLYIPPRARAALTNPGVALYLTEGEKKSAKACQEGFPCVGLGGLWNWLQNGQPIEELNLIVWQERRVVLVPDNDVWQDRDELLHAVYALGAELERRGAFMRVLRIPDEIRG